MMDVLTYVLKNFRLFYEYDTTIGYGATKDAYVLIARHVNDSFFSEHTDMDKNHVVWKEWKGKMIPFCFGHDDRQDIISTDKNAIRINYDIIASAFYFLSGWNEYVSDQKDQFGRITFNHSIIKDLDIGHIPVVNYYFDILYEALCRAGSGKVRSLWNDHDFAVSVTHDIDDCRSAWLEGAFSEFKKFHFLTVIKLIFKRLFGKDAWFNFKEISELEQSLGASSSFYFLPLKGKTGNWKNADYNIKSNDIRNIIRYLLEKGHEIGIHGSFGTHDAVEKFAEDIHLLGTPDITGNRFHFLMFDPLKTTEVLEKNNVKYDTTLAFSEQIGFRRGTCHPFYLYDFKNKRSSNVLEIPLIAMDATLFYPKYMGITKEESVEHIKQLIDEVSKFNGVFTILWHNTYFSPYKYSGWKEVFIEILQYCKQNNALLTNGRTIYERITKR